MNTSIFASPRSWHTLSRNASNALRVTAMPETNSLANSGLLWGQPNSGARRHPAGVRRQRVPPDGAGGDGQPGQQGEMARPCRSQKPAAAALGAKFGKFGAQGL